MNPQTILNAVQDQSGPPARSRPSNESAAVRSVAQACGYTAEDEPVAPSAVHDGLADVLPRFNANDFAAGVYVHASKPASNKPNS